MSKKDRKKVPTLFERAIEWYDSNNCGKQQAALELFPEKQLKAALEGYGRGIEKGKIFKQQKLGSKWQ